MSRAALARQAGVNRTTISGIVQPLLDADVLIETDPLPAAAVGGKRARPLWFSPRARPLCGVLLMADGVSVCLSTIDGQVLVETHADFPIGSSRNDVETIVANRIGDILAQAPRRPLGIGVAVGGMVDTDRGIIVRVNLAPVLDGCPLASLLRERFVLPVVLDHHPRALLVGDRWFGDGRGRDCFAVVYTGEVLGGALSILGQLYRGPAGAGGELGHTFVQLDGALCRCGHRGCWDTVATLGWLREQSSAAGLPGAGAMDSGRLAALAMGDDGQTAEAASALMDLYARNLAVGLANLQQTVAPNVFILHGDVVAGGPPLFEAMRRHLTLMVPARPGCRIELIPGQTGSRAALLGAAGLVLSERLSFPL